MDEKSSYEICIIFIRIPFDITCHSIGISSKSLDRKKNLVKEASGRLIHHPKVNWWTKPLNEDDREAFPFLRLRFHNCLQGNIIVCLFFYRISIDFVLFLTRSAPASPSHIGMSGLVTPESLSREGSPVPEYFDTASGSPVHYEGGTGVVGTGNGSPPQHQQATLITAAGVPVQGSQQLVSALQGIYLFLYKKKR